MRKVRSYDCAAGCPVEAAIDLIGGKWKAVIVHHLLKRRPMRFGELRRTLTRVTHRMLTRQLRELEEDGIVIRTVYAEVPSRVDYRLSDRGQSLAGVIEALRVWGEANHRSLNHEVRRPVGDETFPPALSVRKPSAVIA